MPRFANSKDAYGISDRSGFRYRLGDMRKEWNGMLVGKDEFESKHPQLEPHPRRTDPEALKDPRPDRTETSVAILLTLNPFKTGTSGSSTITVFERSHDRSASDKVRFRDVASFDGITSSVMENSSGLTITSVLGTDHYTVSVSDTATVGSVNGGGGIASAGPITLVN
jgi:hypothetical protein